MAAYVILDMTVTDKAAQAEYRARLPEALAAYGGRVTTRGDVAEPAEEEAAPHRLTVLEFGTVEQAMDWHLLRNATPEQAEVRALRDRMGTVNRVYVVACDDIEQPCRWASSKGSGSRRPPASHQPRVTLGASAFLSRTPCR